MAAPLTRIQSSLEARPSIGGSVLNVRLGDLKEVILAGSNLPPLGSRQADARIGPRRQQILDVNLFLHTFARAWGLEAVEPMPGGVRISLLLLPAPEPPVLQAAIGRAVIELHDGAALAEAWIDPLEPTLEVLATRDHRSVRPSPRPTPRRPPSRKTLLQPPRVLTGADPIRVPLWKRTDVRVALGVLLAGILLLPSLKAQATRSDRDDAWAALVQGANLGDDLQPQVSATARQVQGGLSADDAADALDVLRLAIGRCYIAALQEVQEPGALGGTLGARLTFQGGGRVMAMDGAAASFDDPPLSRCAEQAVRGLQIPAAPAGSSLSLELALSPGPATAGSQS